MTGRPRLRFAPSPTGHLHVGSARSALFNWLYARQAGGTFILRIEDTDQERSRPELVEAITSGMTWLGLDWDEGPYLQSQRGELHRAAADRLVAAGHAYWCDCTREQIEARTKGSPTPGYDRHCRDRGLGPGPGRALRFRVPQEGTTVVADVVRGEPAFENSKIEDFVILKSNGAPVFILANVVDDVDMAVTHVVRGEDHLPNTPKYLLLWRALEGGPEPVFAHLPLLVNERRQKLSKRREDEFVEHYREEGYLPEAMVNYLALLGWSPPDGREILTRDELVAAFRLEDVVSSPAFFDVKKLRHFDGEHIRALPVDEFVERARPWLVAPAAPWPPDRFDEAAFRRMAPLVQERVFVLSEVPAMVDFLFLEDPVIDERAWERRVERGQSAPELLDAAMAAYDAAPTWEASLLHQVTARLAEEHGLGLAKAQFPIRVAVTGRDVGPPLFESLEVLGRERALERLRVARARLAPSPR